TTALGRPNREQVSTMRPSVATTLQALALTNGEVLSDMIKEGSAILNSGEEGRKQLPIQIFRLALGRVPKASEALMLKELSGEKNSVESVEDIIWALVMLPEFQLIY
ncbi:MAG: hypothetical protein VX961_00240, partial [Verrucomicrobiota bacterium]|nr:hypothetical protein [Verrucomicrobiota bacterium]